MNVDCPISAARVCLAKRGLGLHITRALQEHVSSEEGRVLILAAAGPTSSFGLEATATKGAQP